MGEAKAVEREFRAFVRRFRRLRNMQRRYLDTRTPAYLAAAKAMAEEMDRECERLLSGVLAFEKEGKE